MMGESYELKFPIDVTGLPALDNILGKIQGIGGAASETSSQFEKFAAGVKGFIENPLQSAGSAVESFLKTLGPMGSIAVGAAAGITAIGKAGMDAMESLGSLGTEIHNVAIRTGLTTKEVGQFSFAAKVAGTDISTFEMAMRRLSEGLSDSGAESNKARQELERLGITTREPKEVFVQFAEALSHMSNAADRNASAIRLFGRAGMELVPTLLSLNQSLAEAKELGLGPSEESVAQWEKYHHEMVKIEATWDKLVRKLKEGVAAPIYWFMGGDGDLITPPGNAMGFENGAGDPKEYNARLERYAQRFIQQSLGATRGKMAAPGIAAADLGRLGIARGDYDLGQFQDAIGRTKEGVTAKYNAAQGELVSAQEAVNASHGKGTKAVQEATEAYTKAKAEVDKYKSALESFKTAEDAANRLGAFKTSADDAGLNPIQKEINKALALGGGATPALNSILFGRDVMPTFGSGWSLGNAQADAQRLHPGTSMGMLGRLAGPLNQVSADGSIDKDQTTRLAYETKQFQEGLKKTISDDEAAVKSLLSVVDRLDKVQNDHDVRMIEMRLGDSEAGIRAITQKRLELAKDETDVQKIIYDSEERLAELHKRQAEDLKNQADSLASGLFHGIMGGGAGMRSFGTNLLTSQMGQIFTNVTSKYLQTGIGELGKLGDKSGLGKWLGGTLAEHKDAALQTVTQANTDATVANTAALSRLSGFGAGGGGGAGWSGGGYGPFDIAGIPSDTLSGKSEIDYMQSMDGAPFGKFGSDAAMSSGTMAFLKSANFAKAVGIAGAAVAGTMGAISGFSHGGARGDIQGIGSLAGAAGGIMSIAGVTGPAAPIMAGIGLALGMVSAMFGDPKQIRENQINKEIRDALYMAPPSVDVQADVTGARTRTNRAGQIDSTPWDAFAFHVNDPYYIRGPHDSSNLEQVPGTVVYQYNVNIPVNAADAKSFIDQRNNIAAAVHQAMQEGHPINYQVQTLNGH